MSTMTISQPDAKFQSGMRALPAIVSHKNVPESQIYILPFSINDSIRNTRFRSNSAGPKRPHCTTCHNGVLYIKQGLIDKTHKGSLLMCSAIRQSGLNLDDLLL